MPITIKVSNKPSEAVKSWLIDYDPPMDLEDFADCVYPKYNQVVQSSYGPQDPNAPIAPSSNGFFISMLAAYNHHHHIRIRPDDIWISILVQFANYVRGHHEELRKHFVEHEGKKDLHLAYPAKDRFDVDYTVFAEHMADLTRRSFASDDFYNWSMPHFSTTTNHDRIVASVVMMATLQNYVRHNLITWCGIPSVTLLGEREDYADILARLDFLPRFGQEPSRFASLLKPVLQGTLDSFDNPDTAVRFWDNSVVKHSLRSGLTVFSGWITAFCFWDKHGKCIHDYEWDEKEGVDRLVLDGIVFQPIRNDDVTMGYCKLPIRTFDQGKMVEQEILAGSMGIVCTSSSGVRDEKGKLMFDTVQPASGWIVYE